MKKRVTAYVIIVVVLLAVAGAIHYADAEMSALIWHVRHGFHAQLGGIRVGVPFSYEASDPAGTATLSISRYPGHLRHGSGTIIIDFGKRPSPEAEQAAEAMVDAKGTGVKRRRVGEREAIFAGRQGTCVEYIPEINDSALAKLFRANDMREIDCRFNGDVSVMLIGGADLKGDLYKIIETAEPVKRKN